jgi:hypothetical protein
MLNSVSTPPRILAQSMEPTIVMLHTVLVCMLLIRITRFVRLSLLLVGLARRRRISVVVLPVLIRLGVLRSLLGALEMLLLLMALILARGSSMGAVEER